MAKIIIDPNLKGKELFDFLRANKEELIAQKKSVIKFCDTVHYTSGLYVDKAGSLIKASTEEPISPDATKIRVKVVANTSMWCDSHMDVLLKDSAAKSMKERKGMIPHLKNHEYKIESQVGDVKDIYYEDISLRELGLNKSGSAQALVFESDVMKSYDERIFNYYKSGNIKQHSIGLQYMKMGLAINDDEDTAHFELWEKYIDQVINKELCEEKGYFWVIPEYKLLENSCVLFGSNILTPTLDVKQGTVNQPEVSTGEQPLTSGSFDIGKAIDTMKLF